MANLISSVTSVVSGAATWVGTFSTVIAENDILVLGVVAVPLVGLGVGLIRRLISVRV